MTEVIETWRSLENGTVERYKEITVNLPHFIDFIDMIITFDVFNSLLGDVSFRNKCCHAEIAVKRLVSGIKQQMIA